MTDVVKTPSLLTTEQIGNFAANDQWATLISSKTP